MPSDRKLDGPCASACACMGGAAACVPPFGPSGGCSLSDDHGVLAALRRSGPSTFDGNGWRVATPDPITTPSDEAKSDRWVVVVARVDIDSTDLVVLGPFRRRERADARAATVRRLAAKYDEPAGTLHVDVEPVRSGSMAAQEAMDHLYGGAA